MKIKYLIPVMALLLGSCEKQTETEVLRFYGDALEDIGFSIDKTSDGYIIAGQFTRPYRDTTHTRIDSSEMKMIIIRTDINGIETGREIPGSNLKSSGTKVVALEDGSSIAVGYVVDPASKEKDIYVVKMAANGEGYTEKIFRWVGNQYANDIIKTDNGWLILGVTDVARGNTGDTGNKQGNKDILLLSINETLDSLNTTQVGYPGNDEGIRLKLGHGGKFIVVGTTDRNQAVEGNDMFIMSYNLDLNTTAIKPVEGSDDEYASDFEVVADGYMLVGNAVKNNLSHGVVWKISQDITGVPSGHDIYLDEDHSQSFIINSICRYRTSSFLMAGQVGSASTGDMLIFETDSRGYYEGKAKITGGSGNQSAYDVIADGEEIVVTGRNTYETNSLITFLKFRF